MPTQKIDPKVIFASNAPAIDKPPVFSDKTKGWDVTRANDGRPEIKQMNKIQQDTDLKILWLNENSVTPYDASIDYPDGAVTLKDGSFKQLSSGAWVEFLDDFANKDEVKRGIANRYDSSLTYNSGERVVLTNGDIVKSTIDGNTSDPNVNMMGWVNKEKEQDIINSLTASEGINILSVYGGINDFGVAMGLAYTKAVSLNLNTILIPAGRYESITPANLSLVADLNIEFSQGVFIDVKNQIDVFNVVHGVFKLSINGRNVAITPDWSSHNPSIKNVAFRLDSRTLSKSLEMINVQVLLGNRGYDTGFAHAVKAVGLNYSLLQGVLFQAQQPFFCESHPTVYHAMGSNIVDCFMMSPESCITIQNNGVLACEGWSVKGGEYLSDTTGIKIIDNTTHPIYFPPLFHVSDVHLACKKFFDFTGISRVIVSGCDLQATISKDTDYKGLIELEGVQIFSLCGGTVISQTGDSEAHEPEDSKPVLHIRKSARDRLSAHIELGDFQPRLHQNAPLVTFDNDVLYQDRVKISPLAQGSFTGPFCTANDSYRISLNENMFTNNASMIGTVVEGAGVFDPVSGVLDLTTAPSIGNFYYIPSSVVATNTKITQIKTVGHIGKNFFIRFQSNNIRIAHNSNLFTPAYAEILMTRAGIIGVQSYNSEFCQIISVPLGSLADTDIPASTSSDGVHGQKIYSAGFLYEHVFGIGWLKIAAATF